jgi:hypothetical protein
MCAEWEREFGGWVWLGTLLGPEGTDRWPAVSAVGGFVFSRAGLLPYRPELFLLIGVRVWVFGGGVGWLSGCCL